jgi:general secretion pathway protein L
MALFDSSLGIDFRPNTLILTCLKRTFGKIRLQDHEIHTVPPETPKDEREAQTLSVINRFVARNVVDRDRVCISIPREKVVIRFITLPIATKENLRKVIDYETSKYTPFERGETYFDYHVVKEEKESIHLFVVFVKKVEVDAYLSLLKKIGLRPFSIQIPSAAALNLFFYQGGGKEQGASILLDVTDPFVEMNLVQERNLRESFHMPLPPEERASRILSTLKRSGVKEDVLSASTFFVYGLAADETVLSSLKEADHVKAVVPPPLSQIETKEDPSQLYRIYASIGLPLRGMTKTQFDVNLLPFEMRKKIRQIGKPLFIVFAIVAFLLGVSWAAGIFIQYRDALNGVNAEVKKRRPAVEAVEKLQKQKDEFMKEIADLDKIRSEVSKIEILKELTQLIPPSVWVWNFKYNGKEIEISGFADSASDLIPLIDKSALFEKVEFITPVTKERVMIGNEMKEKERFKLKARIEVRKAGS